MELSGNVWPGAPSAAVSTETAPGRLVGRMRESALVRESLDRLGDGSAQLIEVTGDPGIGKTRLLAEITVQARARGFLTLTGRSSECDRGVSFGPLVDALDDPLAQLQPSRLAELRPDRLQLLQTVFPALREHVNPRCCIPCPRSIHSLRRAACDLLEILRDPGPGLVLVLDDLHWADDPFVKLLAQLVRRPPGGRVLLALGYRPRQAPPGLRMALMSGAGGLPVHRLPLGPLGEHEALELIGRRGSLGRTRALYRESGGNPFYLEALASWWDPRLGDGGPGAGELPSAVRLSLLAELEGASPAAGRVARAAAVAGANFCLGLLAEVVGEGEESVSAAVDELISRDLLRPASDLQRFQFRHPLVQHAVYASTNPAWRLAAHARAAAALGRRGAPAVTRAYHVERATGGGDPLDVAVLEEAVCALWISAPSTAVRYAQTAVRLLPPGSASDHRRGRLLVLLGRALAAAGRPRESRELMHKALALIPRDPAGPRAAAALFCAQIERLVGRRAEGEALLRDEIAALVDQGTRAAATLRLEIAVNELAKGDGAACRESAAQALAVARCLDDRPLQAACLGLMAWASLSTAADISAARSCLDAAVSLLDAMLDQEFAESLEAAVWVGWSEIMLERCVDALRHLDRAAAVAEGGRMLVLPQLVTGRVLALRAAGRLHEARACADDALDLATRYGSEAQRAGALFMRGWVDMLMGEVDGALAAGVAAVEHPRVASGSFGTQALRMLAEIRLTAGDEGGCLALIERVGGPELPAVDACSRVDWYELLTRAELAAGRTDAAAEWANRAVAAAGQLGLVGRTGLAGLAQAHVCVVRHPAAAVSTAAAAAAGLAAGGLQLDAVRARVVAAQASAVCGDVDRASAELRAAQTAFEGYAAHVLARDALSKRRRIAARSTRRRSADQAVGFIALTRRERQVAGLVCEGLTNRKISQQLYVTDKTVEMHVANIFAKLNVSSRAGVARVVTTARGAAALDARAG